ncbi:MAG: hypothetical protein QGI83_01705 [Candidatus Latescibacteria bacterium]|nr:hypothetical protein [Candidatus Latescibacterota bacterium]
MTECSEDRYRRMLLALRPDVRLSMACRMFTAAKSLARAGMADLLQTQDERELRRRLFLRFYARDLPPAKVARILRHLDAV